MSHAQLSPSGASKWVKCPGSVKMGQYYPDKGRSEAAEEGTATHWVASEVLEGRGADPFIGRTAPNGIIITHEMIDAARVYVEHVHQIAPLPHKRVVEKIVKVTRVHPTECYGTPDCWYFDEVKKILHVWDLKYGYGIVEPYDNWQLICYVAGIISDALRVSDMDVTVAMHIVQPRPFHVQGSTRTWVVSAVDLRGKINMLSNAASLALSDNAQLSSGDHCRYCSARHACPAAQKASMFSVDYTYSVMPEELSPVALGIEYRTLLRAISSMRDRLTGIEAQIIKLCEDGKGAETGFKAENGTGRLAWSKTADEVITLGDLMGVNLRAPASAITPTEAKKLGLPQEILQIYTNRPVSGIKLVPADHTLAARVFGGNI